MVNINIREPKPRQMSWEEWRAYLQKFEDCTCTEGSALACPSCREYSKRKYGESIPFVAGGKEVG